MRRVWEVSIATAASSVLRMIGTAGSAMLGRKSRNTGRDTRADIFATLLREGDATQRSVTGTDAPGHPLDRPIDMQEFTKALRAEAHGLISHDETVVLLAEDDTFAIADGTLSARIDSVPQIARALHRASTQRSRVLDDSERPLFGPRISSAAYVPVSAGTYIVGIIAIGWNHAATATSANLEPIETLATRVFPSLAATMLYKRALDAEKDALALVDAVGALSSKLTVDEVSNVACLHARKIARAKSARLVLSNSEGGLDVIGCNPGGMHPANRVRNKTSAIRRAIDDEEITSERDEKRLSVFLPVKTDGVVRGVLELTYAPTAPHPADRVARLVGAVAKQTGTALERAERADELQRLAITDPLTGLENRRQLLHDLERDVARAKRTGEPLTVAMVDLDHFKAYNDTHGHLAGDRYLRTFSHFLESQIRTMDVAGRYGGEEFLLVLPDTDAADALAVSLRLQQAWKRSSTVGTFSIGISQLRTSESWMDAVMRADAALFRAKENGRDRVELADDIVITDSAEAQLRLIESDFKSLDDQRTGSITPLRRD